MDDQRWRPGQVKTLIGRLFPIGCTIEGMGKLPHRHEFGVWLAVAEERRPAPSIAPGPGRSSATIKQVRGQNLLRVRVEQRDPVQDLLHGCLHVPPGAVRGAYCQAGARPVCVAGDQLAIDELGIVPQHRDELPRFQQGILCDTDDLFPARMNMSSSWRDGDDGSN
ncbi:winged helix-turn-helix domain-containing protein [Nonomuraea zeae]|uniref:Winged helix-turn-helix domain-containing protein n=1 Tax=Nonomuraea zeae TaxID=1642303 RepID=A0A5S4GMA6_9ACTN|nr:winged helix-turn-helix domain-containing protein [Nonomuraea zeae]TMR34086.1 winged helix-turn-helix domain-containing protein [Nonomuraea zeae]